MQRMPFPRPAPPVQIPLPDDDPLAGLVLTDKDFDLKPSEYGDVDPDLAAKP